MAHPDGSVDPWRDVEQLDLEFALADLSVIEKRIEKLSTSGRHGSAAERESNEQELELLERDEARTLEVLKMRLTRDYSGLWLLAYKPFLST